MSLNELTPKEIVTLYLLNRENIERYNDLFTSREIVEELVIQDNVVMSAHYKMTDDKIEQIRNSTHYQFVLDLNEKLEPIASTIEDVDPDLFNSVLDSLKETI